MGLFSCTPEQAAAIDARIKADREAIVAAGFAPLRKQWFGLICDEFFKSQGHAASLEKDGFIYGHQQALELIGRAEPYPGRVWSPPAPADYWHRRRDEIRATLDAPWLEK